MTHSEPVSAITTMTTVKIIAIMVQPFSDRVFMCRKYTMCTTICTAASTSTISAVTCLSAIVPVITSQNGTAVPGDFTQWHNYAVEWAPDRVVGYIDGQEIFRTTDPAQIPPRPMHLAIQQDIGPYGNDWIPPLDDTSPDQVQLQVDWVRIYSL